MQAINVKEDDILSLHVFETIKSVIGNCKMGFFEFYQSLMFFFDAIPHRMVIKPTCCLRK